MSIPVHAEQSAILKQIANNKFQAGDLSGAIELYTKALSASSASTSVELRRTILANRAQTYIQYGNIHTALRDINLALSSDYTLPGSPKGLTAKCHFRRAKVLFKFAKYNEARSDLEESVRLYTQSGLETTSEQSDLSIGIDEGLNAPQGSPRGWKDELLQAVDSRGIIVRDNARSNFPQSPADSHILNHGDQGITFSTSDGQIDRTLADPCSTAIAIPVYIVAPFFKIKQGQGREPYYSNSSEGPISENKTVESLLEKSFSSAAVCLTAYNGSTRDFCKKAISQGVDLDDPETSTVMVHTSCHRIFAIPRSTTLRQIFAGVRWPRDDPAPFEDLRRVPRIRDFEEDGVELVEGWHMEIAETSGTHFL